MNHWLNLPTALTLCRIGAVPLIFSLCSAGHPLYAAYCALLAALTDYFDGRLARQRNQVTLTGAILDPVADKIFVISLFGLLASNGAIPWWLFILALARNLSQLCAIPVLMAWKKIPFKVRPAFLPKFASGLSFAIGVVGLAALDPEVAPSLAPVVRWVLPAIFLLQGSMETQILVTFWPRFFQILNRKHDTFE